VLRLWALLALGALTTLAAHAAAPAAAALPPAIGIATGDAGSNADWAATLERIAGSVVAIQLDQTRSFDTERNTSAQATGFVVDAER
jgi:S1-C subfamily serine protease